MARRPETFRVPGTFATIVAAFFIFHLSFCFSASAQIGRQEIPSPISTRTISPRFEHLGLEDGLSQSSVFDIFQDSRGFIWMTGQDGLNRYDGHEVKSYTHQPYDETSITGNFLFGITEDSTGAIWVAGQGLNRLDPVSDTFERFVHDPDDATSIGGQWVMDVLVSSDGRVWAATIDGLSRMDAVKRGVFETFRHDPEDEQSLAHDVVFGLFEDSDGRIWAATQNGVCATDQVEPGRFDCHLVRPGFTDRGFRGSFDTETYAFLERPQEPGVLWIGSAKGIVRLDVHSGKTDRFVVDHDEEGSNARVDNVYSIAQDPVNPSILWVPTFGGGLARFEVGLNRFVTYHHDERNRNSLREDALTSVFADRSGIVWVGTFVNGASRFNPASVAFAHFQPEGPDSRTSLPGQIVFAIHESRDGVLWVGTVDKSGRRRLTALDRTAESAVHYEHSADNPSSRDPGNVSFVFEDDRLNLWVGSSRGVDQLDRRTGRFRHFRPSAADPTSIPGSARCMYQDRSGYLWIGTTDGMARMHPDRIGVFERFDLSPPDPEPGSHDIESIIEDLAGFIWAGTDQGLARLDPNSGRVTRYDHDADDRGTISTRWVAVIHERRRDPGILWIGTIGGGLDRLDMGSGEIRHLTVEDGLPNNSVWGIEEDELGRLWISTNRGFARFDPDTETFKSYGMEIGIQSLEFSEKAHHRSRRTGELFFGGANGLNAFFPNEVFENMNVPEVSLVDLKLFNQSVRTSGAVKLDKPLSEIREIALDYSQKDLTFDFVAFHYADPTANEYAYKLDGFNEDWVYVGDQRTASFTNLDPGEYIFHVKAANSDGVWNEEGASLRIVISPPFWATWWFRILTILGFGGLLYFGYSVRVRQIAQRNRQLEAEVGKRTAELQESKDQVELINEHLEQSHIIVEAINQETSFRRLLTKILEESRVIPGVEKATALVRMPDDLFHVRASSGWDVTAMQRIAFTRKEAHARYVEQSEEVSKNIFVAKNVSERAGNEQMAEFGQVASFLVLRIVVEGDVTAYLVFDNVTDSDAFDQRDVALLVRLREHIQSAFIKTRILEDLQETLANLRSTQDRLIQSEKMASLGQLTAGIAHEIKNPLNFVNNFSDVTAEVADDMAEELAKRRDEMPPDLASEFQDMIDSLRSNAQKISEHGKRADAIVQNMLEHSKVGEGERHPTVLNDLLEEYITLARHGLEAREAGFKVDVTKDFDETVGQIDLVPQDIGRVFMNLLGNAFDAVRQSGSNNRPAVVVSTAKVDGTVEIRVADNGPGIPEKVRARIFEPFFTTKPTGSGTGLGLSMSYDIVTKGHGGSLEVVSEEGEGATFIVRLPA